MTTPQSHCVTIDQIDLEIIGLLLEDARRTFAEIGEKLGVSKKKKRESQVISPLLLKFKSYPVLQQENSTPQYA